MKKIIYSAFIALAGLLLSSCEQEHIEYVYDPAAASVQVLGGIDGCTLVKGENITASFDAASFGVPAASTYALYADVNADMRSKSKFNSTISVSDGKGAVTMAQKDINSYILANGGKAGESFTVYFQILGYIANDKGTAISSTELASNISSASFIPYQTDINDQDLYDKVWVIGASSAVGSWSFDKVYQFLYEYNKNTGVYTGVIDFGDNAAGGWKITGVGNWNEDASNWGSEAQDESSEQDVIQLISGGASKDIKCYSKRFYKFSLDRASLTLTKAWGIDNIGIVGDFNSWNAADAAMKMSYNGTKHRFYIDYTFSTDAQLKFTADDSWDLNWGVNCVNNGDNIAVSAGSYRIYLDLNYGEYSFDATMFGQEEPGVTGGGDTPTKPQAWSLIGTLDGSSWDTDFDLTNTSGDVWIIRGVKITASDEFKIRADHDWSNNVGGPEANSTSTIDPSNPYDVYKPALGETFNAGDKNIQIGAEGSYDVTLNYSADGITVLVEEHKAVYSLIGQIDGDAWTKDIVMTQNGDIWTSPVVNITGGFKIRYDYSWADANTYGVAEGFSPVVGEAFTAAQPGSDITVPEAGDYKVTFNASTLEVTIVSVLYPETMYMIGEAFGNWDWGSDGIVVLNPVYGQDGEFWTIRYIDAGSPFKFCSKKAWDGDFYALDTNNGFVREDGNCKVEESGIYMIHIDIARGILNIEAAKVYGIGNCFGGWDAGMESALFTADGKTMKATLQNDGEIRIYAASSIADSDWWTREFIFFDGKIAYRGKGDDQDRVSGTKGQTVTLDFNAGTAELK